MVELAVDSHEDLVGVPFVTEATLGAPEDAFVARTEHQAPAADGLVGDDDPAFGEEILDVPIAQAEPVYSHTACVMSSGGSR